MEQQVVEILLVEDNPTDAELTQRALRKQNLANRLVWVKDGAEALDFVYCRGAYAERDITNTPRVILLDLRLPKVDGMEVLRRLKSDERTSMIPVVVLTSSKEDRDMVESYKLGVNSFVAKPVDFSEFVTTISEMGFYWVFLNKQPAL